MPEEPFSEGNDQLRDSLGFGGQPQCSSTAWCSEIGSLTSLDAYKSGASIDCREPISLHQAVLF